MANLVNINGTDDPSYRYKMPKLVSKVEGRGNGVKTVLVNCEDVAEALKRPPAQVTKFFGCELGAMTKFEAKDCRCLVNGAFETKDLQELLTTYIEKFVLCPDCGNPETQQEIKGKKKQASIFLNCAACGATSEADNAHKLVTFIVKELSPEEAKSKKKERREKKNKEKKRDSGDSVDDSVSTGDKDSVLKKDKKKKDKKVKKSKKSKDDEKKKKKKKEKKSAEEKENKKSNVDSDSSSDSDDGFGDDTAKEFESMTVHDASSIDDAAAKAYAVVREGVTAATLSAKLNELQISCGLKKTELVAVCMYSVFVSEVPLASIMANISVLTEYKSYFDEEKDFQAEVLIALEEAVAREDSAENKAKLLKMVPVVIKQLYDDDILDEVAVNSWYSGVMTQFGSGFEIKYVHKRAIVSDEEVAAIKKEAKPIIDWLKHADTDSDDESDTTEDDDDEEDN